MKNRAKKHYRKLNSAILADIVTRIVKVANPEKIILFGSAARGELGPNSDLDFLVIKPGHFDRGRLAGDIYMQMEGAGEAVDVIIVTPEEVSQYHDIPWLVIAPALKEGRVVYAG
jgi:predicted nucleotidyltransferase